ncbi:protease [Salmovirus WFRC1]|uniref:protease n=1 Tax=Salmovirus WFRC1 TaxID=1981916 RepID=UPI000A209920|nr:protease [Salmovirus WFRC1]ARK19506.1 protease [Salmovirus WFRC1]
MSPKRDQPVSVMTIAPYVLLGVVGGFAYAAMSSACSDCEHTCQGTFTDGMCLMCQKGELQCESCEQSAAETPTKTRKRRKYKKECIASLWGEVREGFALWSPLAAVFGLHHYRDAMLASKALEGLEGLVKKVWHLGDKPKPEFSISDCINRVNKRILSMGDGYEADDEIMGYSTEGSASRARERYENSKNRYDREGERKFIERAKLGFFGGCIDKVSNVCTNGLGFGLAAALFGCFIYRQRVRRSLIYGTDAVKKTCDKWMKKDTESRISGSHTFTGCDKICRAVAQISTESGSVGTAFKCGKYWITAGHVVKSGTAYLHTPSGKEATEVIKFFPTANDGITVMASKYSPMGLRSVPVSVLTSALPGFVVGCQNGDPHLSTGLVEPDGTHYCSTTFGHSGAPVVAHNGVVVGVHILGDEDVNGYLPMTRDIISFLREGPSAPVKKKAVVPQDVVSMAPITDLLSQGMQQASVSNTLEKPGPCSHGQGLIVDLPLQRSSSLESLDSSSRVSKQHDLKRRKKKWQKSSAVQPGVAAASV